MENTISLAYKILLKKEKKLTYIQSTFYAMGHPQDLQEYQLWSNTFNSIIKNDIKKDLNKNYGINITNGRTWQKILLVKRYKNKPLQKFRKLMLIQVLMIYQNSGITFLF